MKKMTKLEEHYNKFSEEKRLTRRHGQVEYFTTMTYLHKYLEKLTQSQSPQDIRILDVGAGTGRYAIALAEEAYQVTALELVKYNVGILKSKNSNVQAFQGNAMNLKRFPSDYFDVTLVFGPMYHLFSEADKIQVLKEAERVTKPGGYVFVAYLMNEYSILVHGFRDNYIEECMANGQVTSDFHVCNTEADLYDYVRVEDIDGFNQATALQRVQIVAATGAANYMRPTLNAMSETTFQHFLSYHLATCERPDLLGASSHTLDILQKPFE